MGWIEGLNDAMGYIEENLDGGLDAARAARLAACTEGQFRRMFSYIAGIGLAEYVRRRRISRAALDLSRGERVADVAVRYGYGSPTAFTRAFREALGVSPSEAKRPGARLSLFPRLSFSLSVTGAEPLSWRVVRQDEMRLVGMSLACGVSDAQPLAQMEAEGREALRGFWGGASRGSRIEDLRALADGSGPGGMLGVNVSEGGEASYRIAVASSSAEVPEWASEIRVPAGSWAVFDCTGPCDEATAEHYRRIFSEWLPSSGYELAGDVSLEAYPRGDFLSAGYRSEIWMPVARRPRG